MSTGTAEWAAKNWQQGMPDAVAYAIDRILFDVQHKRPDFERFVADRDAYMAPFSLPTAIRQALKDNDFGVLYLAGANPYLLRAHCLALKVPEDVFLSSLRAITVG
jgi:cytochrome P450